MDFIGLILFPYPSQKTCRITFLKNSIFAYSQQLSMKEVKNKINSLSKDLLDEITIIQATNPFQSRTGI